MSPSALTARALAWPALATWTLSSLVLGLSACSNSVGGGGDDEYESVASTLNGDGTDTAESDDESGSEGEGETEGDSETSSDGGEDEGGEPDPRMTGAACDPYVGQLHGYDLAGVNMELAPALVREAVLYGAGQVPDIPLSLQPFFNHFDFGVAPALGAGLSVDGQLWASGPGNADSPERYRLQFAVSAPAVSPGQRPPVDLAIVVDLGPSMAGEPLALAEDALSALENALLPGDRVTLIVAGDTAEVLTSAGIVQVETMPLTGLLNDEGAPGYADLPGALELAYVALDESWEGEELLGQHRVVLISNGHFTAGEDLRELVEEEAKDGRYLISLALGDPDLYADREIRELARAGHGSALYARQADALWTVLHDDFTERMIAVSAELEATLELPHGLALRSRRDPRRGTGPASSVGMLGANGTFIFHHELEACADLDLNTAIVVELSWRDPVTAETVSTSWELPLEAIAEPDAAGLKGAAVAGYSHALAAYRDSEGMPADYGTVLGASTMIAVALEMNPEDLDLIEMSEVLAQLETVP